MNAIFDAAQAPLYVSGLGSIMNIHPRGAPGEVDLLRKLLFVDLSRAGIYFSLRGLFALLQPIGDRKTDSFFPALEDFLNGRCAALAT